ncbi:MAG: hypothetical protein LBM70_02335 [Victivallales bacterium]|jgi:hypothetical protein|nr:hypothetical protein [Victivallales bacterium]
MRKFLSLFFAMFFAVCLHGAAFGPQIFSDDFETVGLFAENWEASKGLKPENGVVKIIGHGNIKLRRKMTDKDFAASVDLTPGKNVGEYGHTGFTLDGIHFMLRGDGGVGTAYRPAGNERSLGQTAKIPGYKFGDPCRVTIIRQRTGESRKYVFMVNGKTLISFQDSSMVPNDTINIYCYRAMLTIDNFSLNSVGKGSDSPNLTVNSSFEHLLDGMPTYVNLATNRNLTWKAPYSEYLKTAVIDTKVKHSGNNSLRLTFNDSVTKAGFQMWNAGCAVGKPVTGSLYLKADRPGLIATLVFWELHHKTHTLKIKVTDQWQRYEYTLFNPERNQVQFGVSIAEPGVLWVDDVQVELGEKATAYKVSALDEDKFGTNSQVAPAIIPDTKIVVAEKPLTIDGNLTDFPKGCKVDAFLHRNADAPKDKTTAYLACDAKNLYVAFRCVVPDLSKVKQEQFPRDTAYVYKPESIELFFDPTGGGKEYYQFAVNSGNSQADCGPGRNLGWNGNFHSAVRLNQAESSIDYEIAIPLSNFADAELSDSWGFNLGRNCKDSNQTLSLLRTTQLNYHLVAIYPKLIFPKGILNAARIGVVSSALYQGVNNKAVFGATVQNLSGKEIKNGTIQLSDTKTGDKLGSSVVNLPLGNSAVKFVSELQNSVRNRDVTVELIAADNTILTRKNFIVSVSGPLNVYSRYNFYMGNSNAEFIGSCSLPAGEYRGVATIDGKKFDFKVAPEFNAQIPLQNFNPGKYQINFDIFSQNEKVTSFTAELNLLADYKLPYCRIDRKNRTLEIDGKPALIVAPFLGVERKFTPEMSRNIVKTLAEAGFKYITAGSHEVDNAATKAFIDEAAKYDIKIVYWNFYAWRMRDKWNKEEFAAKVRQYPNVIAVLIVDEPELYAKSDEVKTFMEEYQKALPEMPVFMNNTIIGIPARFAGLTTDIVMIDDYLTNRENRTVMEMLNAAEMTEKAGRSERKPAWFFPSGDNLHNHYRECSYEEQMAQCYGMLIRDCTGLVHFCGLPKYPRNWEALQQLNREFLVLQDVVFSDEACSDAVSSDKSLAFITRKLGNKVYVIALNPESKSANVTFRLPAEFKYAAKAEIRFENRSLPVADGTIQDTLKPLERRVYMIETVK